MIHNGYNPIQSGFNNADASEARADAREARSEAEQLRFDVNRLLMITEALWGILREKHGYTDDELVRRVYEIDAADGTLDGRKSRGPAKDCPHCARKLARKRPRCLYCGKLVAVDLFEP